MLVSLLPFPGIRNSSADGLHSRHPTIFFYFFFKLKVGSPVSLCLVLRRSGFWRVRKSVAVVRVFSYKSLWFLFSWHSLMFFFFFCPVYSLIIHFSPTLVWVETDLNKARHKGFVWLRALVENINKAVIKKIFKAKGRITSFNQGMKVHNTHTVLRACICPRRRGFVFDQHKGFCTA